MSNEPFFHDDSGTVRFWVEVEWPPQGTPIGTETLHYRQAAQRTDDDPLSSYLAHVAEISAAARRRVEKGLIEPVMLRAPDVREGSGPQ